MFCYAKFLRFVLFHFVSFSSNELYLYDGLVAL